MEKYTNIEQLAKQVLGKELTDSLESVDVSLDLDFEVQKTKNKRTLKTSFKLNITGFNLFTIGSFVVSALLIVAFIVYLP